MTTMCMKTWNEEGSIYGSMMISFFLVGTLGKTLEIFSFIHGKIRISNHSRVIFLWSCWHPPSPDHAWVFLILLGLRLPRKVLEFLDAWCAYFDQSKHSKTTPDGRTPWQPPSPPPPNILCIIRTVLYHNVLLRTSRIPVRPHRLYYCIHTRTIDI